MDETVIEAVAKAIYEADPESGYDPEDGGTGWNSNRWHDGVWSVWRTIAIAAIGAFKEASDKSIEETP